ncbi:MAG: sulfite oxidase heme-binding subunit YedZ [Rhodospirillales bacterium]
MASVISDRFLRFGLKPTVFVVSLLPMAWLIGLGFSGGLGANPVEALTRGMGDWALRFLLITLALTPLRQVTGWTGFVRFRRMLGLFAFFYATLHLLSYLGLDHGFDFGLLWADIVKRLYITIGMAGFVILVVLAATSPKAAVKRLGGKRWQALHRTVYAAGILAVLHFYLMVKADHREPLIYGGILAVLLGFRLFRFQVAKRARRLRPSSLAR